MLPSLQSANKAIEAKEYQNALNELENYITASYSPSQIDDGVRFLLANKGNFKELDLNKTFTLLQSAVSQKILSVGETPDAFYGFLYDIVPNLESNGLINETIIALRDYYSSIDKDGTEALVIRNLLFTLGIFNGNKENAFDEYFKDTLYSDIAQMEILPDGVKLFMGLLQNFSLPFSRLQAIYEQIFCLDNFFKLDARTRRGVFAWSFHCVWNVPCYFNNLGWAELFDSWKAVLYRYLQEEKIDEAMYLHFYIHHKMGNSAQGAEDWRKFNTQIEMPCSIAYTNYAKTLNLAAISNNSNKKTKIALLMERVVLNSPLKVTLGLLKALSEDKSFTDNYEVCVYSMNYFEKSQDSQDAIKALQEFGVPLFSPAYMLSSAHYHVNHLEKALMIRDAIIRDGIDILIGCTNNFAIESFLFGSRSAQKQIFWCHGNFEYDVVSIDKRITHIALDSPLNKSSFEFSKFEAVPIDEHLKGKASEEEYKAIAEQIKKRFSKDTIILGSIGRLVKIDNDEYLSAVAEILNQTQNTVYLACGAGDVASIKARAAKFNMPIDRFYFEGHVDPHIYGHAIDVYLNTFPNPSGEAVREFTSKGENKYVVNYEG